MAVETRGTVPVTLECGGVVMVKKLGRSVVEACVAAAGGNPEEDSCRVMLVQFMVRAAIVGGKNLAGDDNESIEFSTTRIPIVGVVASEAVYDGLSTADTVAIFQACQGKVAGADAKNSGTPAAS